MNKASFYFEFENRYRGSRVQVKDALKGYGSFLKKIIKTKSKPSVLDIGCGRGEWLELCKELGFICLGIDSNKYMTELNSGSDVEVLQGNAFEILPKLSTNKFDLISAFHFIEHINHDSLINLFVECERLLSDDGFLLLETPSIDNLSVSSRLFHLDPTHINPINPDGISFLLESVGFHKPKYFFINGGPLQDSSQHTITRILNGVSQDICIISTKSKIQSEEFFLNETSWQSEINQSISTIQAAEQHDNFLRQLESRISLQDEAIFDLRRRLNYYENTNMKLSSYIKKE